MVVALIIAGGSGQRMGQDIPKQFIHVQNKPVIIYTMEKFQNCPQVDKILVVTLPHWIDFVYAYAKQFEISKLAWVVPGGETGHDSIHNGIMKLKDEKCSDDTVVMVHDGIRPMIDNDLICENLAVFNQYGSAITAIPCPEVMFRKNDTPTCYTEIPRAELMRTQTPQTYTLGKLLWAHEEAAKRK